MGFRKREKERLVPLKHKLFKDPAACVPGTYSRNGIEYDFCLKNEYAAYNLHDLLRAPALRYFQDRSIHWHDGVSGETGVPFPSNHLCCSQSACVNAWFPYIDRPDLLVRVLKELGLDVAEVLPFTLDKPLEAGKPPYVAFEWICAHNYLREGPGGKPTPDEKRTRGANATSADFAFRFKRKSDKAIQIMLGEWKYTEYYTKGKSIQISEKGTDRLVTYSPFLKHKDSPIRKGVQHEDLLYDPFDQLMRLHLLAKEMERASEMDAAIVTVMHVAPSMNRELINRVTSPGLTAHGKDIYSVWTSVLSDKTTFMPVSTDRLLQSLVNNSPNADWAKYINLRYGGMK